jgi:hypothetical protein
MSFRANELEIVANNILRQYGTKCFLSIFKIPFLTAETTENSVKGENVQ